MFYDIQCTFYRREPFRKMRDDVGVSELPWHRFLGKLDLEIIGAGCITGHRKWGIHRYFSGDMFFRLYLPSGGVFYLDYDGESVKAERGSIILVPPSVPFRYRLKTFTDHAWIHFHSELLKSLFVTRPAIALPVKNPERMELRFRKIREELKSIRNFSDDLAVRNRVFSLLAPFLTVLLSERTEDSALNRDPVFVRVLEEIDRNLNRSLRIGELREKTELSQPDFSRLFRQRFGLPPKQYITWRRISRAKELLNRTRLPVKEIAFRCGFEDRYLFYRLFRKNTGMRPSEYRKRCATD